jgi:hypothetical protein
MGRMKEICIQIMNANGGIPEGMTIADVARMKDLEIYEWKEYERRKRLDEEKSKTEAYNYKVATDEAEKQIRQKEIIKQYPKGEQ